MLDTPGGVLLSGMLAVAFALFMAFLAGIVFHLGWALVA